jgi:hypothetical protein
VQMIFVEPSAGKLEILRGRSPERNIGFADRPGFGSAVAEQALRRLSRSCLRLRSFAKYIGGGLHYVTCH